MRTYLDCIPCFFAQALRAARIAGADENMQKKILDEVSKLVPDFPLDSTPPEMGRIVYQLVSKLTGNEDPFREIKKSSILGKAIPGYSKEPLTLVGHRCTTNDENS